MAKETWSMGDSTQRRRGWQAAVIAAAPVVALVALVAMSIVMSTESNGHRVTYDGGMESEPWHLSRVKANSLVIEVEHGACDRFRTTEVEESAAAVTVGAVYDLAGDDDGDCTMEAILECHSITLNQPLGERTLLHAITNLDGGDVGATAPDTDTGATGSCLGRPIVGHIDASLSREQTR